MSEVEVVECAVIIRKLERAGVGVRVEGEMVVVEGLRPGASAYLVSGAETLVGRARAVALALERGPGFGAGIIEDRVCSSRENRRQRARAIAAGDVPEIQASAPTAAAVPRPGGGKLGGLTPAPEPPPSAQAFFLDRGPG